MDSQTSLFRYYLFRGAGTNLKVDEAHTSKFLSCPSTFWLYKYTISRFGARFRDGQYI